jgi:integrase/recombinase XerD
VKVEDPPRLAQLVSRYVQALAGRGYSTATAQNHLVGLRKFGAFLVGHGIGDPLRMTPALLEDFRMEVMRTPTAKGLPRRASTINNVLLAVKGFYRVLVELDVVPVDPTRKLCLVRMPQRLPPPVLKVEEMARLLDSIDPSTPHGGRDRALFELMYSTGMRAGEIVALEVADVDLDGRMVRIRHGKGGKQRVVPFGKVAAMYLENYLRWIRPGLCQQRRAAPTALWLSYQGAPLGYSAVGKHLRRFVTALGLEKRLSPHGLRHACATHLLDRRAELRHIQELLGHSSVETTQIYTHVSIGHLRETLKRCHPRERGNLEAKDNDDG